MKTNKQRKYSERQEPNPVPIQIPIASTPPQARDNNGNGTIHTPVTDSRKDEQNAKSVFIGPLDLDSVHRAANAKANAFAAKTGAYKVRVETLLGDWSNELTELLKNPENSSPSQHRRAVALRVWVAGIMVGVIAAGAWVRWIIQSTNDPLLAVLLGAMIPITAVSLDYWVWRSTDRSRDRALCVITWGLAIGGLGLVAAVAQHFGFEAPAALDMNSLLSGDDNRAVMVPTDLIGVCGSALLMAWADDLVKSPVERLRNRIAAKKAALEMLNAKQQKVRDRAMRRGIRILLAAHRTAV